ncbi:peptide ABC transporter permease [Agathobacter rectalis]|jgi:putative ABC transport system permease protein|uniref:Peptide ABC transporter permease n=2 Tax=Agathobacter rectalis TaxID=39491 RepID=A0A414ISR9_9FIRM|nr:ABC transporter permease [Agathobacter rectalis]RGT10258.1 peptide ABC transporter permease [Agathobacter rectalis]RGT17789.1 peptide ABC transporter permease [Agathobacter rectalis]RHC35507.1 peptide ABC transporter permease [Agathobacter rectalis]RHE31536.1 peptide ABC transporter permease [Agathobacter rectalis]
MNLMKKLTLKNLKLNRKRTIVTIVGIILATALLSALVTLVSSFQYSMIEYQKQKDGDFHVKFSGVKMSELSEFKNNRNIESTFETMGMGFAKLDGCKNEDKPYAYVMATDEAGFEKGCFNLIEGRMAKNEDEIVIPRHLKTNGRIDIKVGDEITLDIGKRYDSSTESVIWENIAYEHEAETLTDTVTKQYKVVGIMERPGYGMEDYSAAGYTFVTYSDELAAIDNGTKSEESEADNTLTVYSRYTQKALRNKDAVTADIIGVDEKLFEKANNSSVEMSAEESDRFLKEMENAKYDIYINRFLISYECVFPIDGTFKALFTVATVVALIIILTSVYCIKNSFNISITEKIRQYGMLASVGATRRQIKSSVKTEAAMLGVVGIPVGTMSGILASLILVKVVNALSAGWLNFALSFHTSLPALILAVILSIATIYFSATGSARRAAKVTPLEAIRNTKEIKIKSSKLKTPAIIGRIWGIGGVISYKNIKRNNKKYRTTVTSIVICSVTFIVISYFMSMAFSMVGMSYASADYNIGINMSYKKDIHIDIEKLSKLVSGIEGVDDYLVGAGYDFDVDKPEYTKEYGEYCRQLYDDSEDVSQMFLITVLDDKSYDKYASDAGIKNAAAGAILVNKGTFDVYNENSSKYVKKEMELYKYKAGDTIECGYNVYDDASSDDNAAEGDTESSTDDNNAVEGDTESGTEDNSGYVDEETINNGVRKTVDVTIVGVTDKVPTGYKGYGNTTLLFMNQKGFESLWADGKSGNELKPGHASYSAYVVAENADEYQDTFEKETEGNPEYSQISFYVSNLDKQMRDEKSLFTLLGVFAYGLIVVIALIGITNIINTLSTGMELRSREFATLRSIGMTDKQFAGMVRLESVFISVKALVIGVPLGILISYLLCVMMNRMDDAIIYEPPYKAIILCIVVVIMLIYAIMKLSMTKLRHNNIIETIKNENL